MCLCLLAVFFYALMAFGKATSCLTVVNAIHDFSIQLWQTSSLFYSGSNTHYSMWYGPYFFPFQSLTLDIASILFINSFMSIIRGNLYFVYIYVNHTCII